MHKNVEAHPKWMRINELVEITGVSRYTIHYYLKEKLLPPPLKTARTMALYSNIHIECLRLVRELREKRGMSVAAARIQVRSRFAEGWKRPGSTEALSGKDPRRGQKGKRQRQRLVKKSVEFFSLKGYHRTHVSHITDALHVSKGTFYQYFEDKSHLFVAVFDHLIRLLTRTEEKIAGETDFFVRMRKRGRAYFRFYQKYHKIIDIIRAEFIGLEDRPEVSIKAIYQKMLDPMYEDTRKAQADGLISNTVDPEIYVDMLFGAYDFLCYRLLMGCRYTQDEIREMATQLFLRQGAVLSPPKKRN